MTVKKMEGKPNMALSAEDEVRETMTSKRLRVRIGYATAAAQEISGDQAMSCELPDGRFAFCRMAWVRARRLRQKAGAWCADCAVT